MKNVWKKVNALLLTGALIVSMSACGDGSNEVPQENQNEEVSGTEQESQPQETEKEETEESTVQETYNDVPTIEADANESDADYYEKCWEAEVYNYKLIRNIPTTYDGTTWDNYCSTANILTTMENPSELNETEQGLVDKAAEARKNLVQTMSLEDSIWYLWNDYMPMAEDAESLEFTLESYDNSDFKPFLVPYLLEDQSQVKGNMIIIAGGGFSSRGNAGEGYPVAAAFNDLGYNCYVLQRRVIPYSPDDIWMDMQRSVRLVRSKIDELGLGGVDCIAASGFSGGSATILGEVADFYGDIQPTIIDENYQPDDIDAYSADLTVVCAMYGPNYAGVEDFTGLITDNPNLPAFFIGGGADDTLTYEDDFKLAASVKDRAPAVEIHTFANVGHGFGVGVTGTNSVLWATLADGFMQQVVAGGKVETESAEVEVPAEYTKAQTFTVPFGFGDTDVTYAANEDESKFYIYFIAFEDTQILEGTVTDGKATVTFDKSGFMSGDAQMIVDSADSTAWNPIE